MSSEDLFMYHNDYYRQAKNRMLTSINVQYGNKALRIFTFISKVHPSAVGCMQSGNRRIPNNELYFIDDGCENWNKKPEFQ